MDRARTQPTGNRRPDRAGAGDPAGAAATPASTRVRPAAAQAFGLLLAASDVDVVEAYTLPFAAFLLAVGLWAMRDADGPGSVRALLPGVATAMLPSLPLALDEPTSLRALLLGIGAALALTVGTWRRWQVPFVAGALVLTALTVANLGPVALAVPRWTLLAVAGAVLGGAGITWEDRVRDGRAAIRYVGSMR